MVFTIIFGVCVFIGMLFGLFIAYTEDEREIKWCFWAPFIFGTIAAFFALLLCLST